MTRIAILDDYQGVVLSLADWDGLHACEVTGFRNTLKDESALAARLQDFDLVCLMRARRIAGAGLDVHDEEPLHADHPLRGLDNTVLLPHAGCVAQETLHELYAGMLENTRAWLEGTPIRELTRVS